MNKIAYILAIILILLVGGFIFSKLQGCGKPVENTTTVSPLKTFTPSPEDKKLVDSSHVAIARINPKEGTKRNNPWTQTDTHIVVLADVKCNTCISYIEVDKTRKFVGFDFAPKIFASYDLNKFSFGYDQGIYRYGKYSLDGLISFPGIGLGVSYNLTNTIFLLGGAEISYVSYGDISQVNTYKFGFGPTVQPIIAIGISL